jgi:MFS family permease
VTGWLRGIGGNVLVLGLVSLLTDISSEMIYPLLPLFLTVTLGAGPAFLGLLEGAAETTAALLKLAAGLASDRLPRRKPLVLAGYTLSSLARPLIALATAPGAVLAIRLADRVGKGIRTAPRDALIADSVPADRRGAAFGFHRAMDHTGALIGPLVATMLLARFTSDLRVVFWAAAVPGVLAVLIIVTSVREVARRQTSDGRFLGDIPTGRLRNYLLIIFLFTLGNSSDAFLLLRAGSLGVPAGRLPLLWAFFHVSKMLTAVPFGALSDRVGRRRVIIAGWLVYAGAYLGFARATSEWQIWLLFAVYGLFYGLTEGVEKAFLADMVEPARRGSAFGWYNCAVGIGALPASLLFGLIWQQLSPRAAFITGAGLACIAALLLAGLTGERRPDAS